MEDYHIENAGIKDVLNGIERLLNDTATTGNPHHFSFIGPQRRLAFNCIKTDEVFEQPNHLMVNEGFSQTQAKNHAITHIDELLADFFDDICDRFRNQIDSDEVRFVFRNDTLFIYSPELILLIGDEFGKTDD